MIEIIIYSFLVSVAIIASYWVINNAATFLLKKGGFPVEVSKKIHFYTKIVLIIISFLVVSVALIFVKLNLKIPQQLAITSASIGIIKVDIYNEMQKIQKEKDILERIVLNHKELIAIPSIGRIKVDIYTEVQKIQKEIDILERIVLNHKELFSSFMNRIDIDFNKEKEQLYKEVEYNIKEMRAYLRYLRDEDLSNIYRLDQGKDIIDLNPDGVKKKYRVKSIPKKSSEMGKKIFVNR